ncbi:hypothetical protein FFF34_008560 [Inquilinus sp. KBS0705]|nr:hypothetical protein FFF34_008560 [Inquilinus sp. KBS0705]
MKTISVNGNPESMTAIMVPKSTDYHDHETIRLESADHNHTVEKTIFRIVDGGEDHWELQFE